MNIKMYRNIAFHIKVCGICLLGIYTTYSDVIFSNGFEGTDSELITIWGDQQVTKKRISDPGPFKRTNNKVLELKILANKQGSAGCQKIFTPGYKKLYARWYMNFKKGADFTKGKVGPRHGTWFSAGNTGHGNAGYIPEPNDNFGFSVEPDKKGIMRLYTYYHGMECTNPPAPGPNCWGKIFGNSSITPPIKADEWFCVEVMIDAGTPTQTIKNADGEFNLWINGVQIGPWKKLWLRNNDLLKVDRLILEIYVEPSLSEDVRVLYDEIIISTSKIGCIEKPIDTVSVNGNLKRKMFPYSPKKVVKGVWSQLTHDNIYRKIVICDYLGRELYTVDGSSNFSLVKTVSNANDRLNGVFYIKYIN